MIGNLQAFSFSPQCPKCGSKDIHRKYHEDGFVTGCSVAWDERRGVGEHFEMYCRGCNYEWREKIKEQTMSSSLPDVRSTELDPLTAQFHEKYTWARCTNEVSHLVGLQVGQTTPTSCCQGTGFKHPQLSRKCGHFAGSSEEDVPMFWLPEKCGACRGTGREPLPITLEHVLDVARQIGRVHKVLKGLDELAYGWSRLPDWKQIALMALLEG